MVIVLKAELLKASNGISFRFLPKTTSLRDELDMKAPFPNLNTESGITIFVIFDFLCMRNHQSLLDLQGKRG